MTLLYMVTVYTVYNVHMVTVYTEYVHMVTVYTEYVHITCWTGFLFNAFLWNWAVWWSQDNKVIYCCSQTLQYIILLD